MADLPFTLDQLRILRAIASEGSFKKAADSLYVTQPAVSLQIQNLEKQLSVSLFDRGGRKAQLTEAGHLLLSYCDRILSQCQEACRALEDLHNLRGGSLIVGASQTTGTYVMPRMIGLFRQKYPEVAVQLQVHSTRRTGWSVANGQVDLAIIGGELPTELCELLQGASQGAIGTGKYRQHLLAKGICCPGAVPGGMGDQLELAAHQQVGYLGAVQAASRELPFNRHHGQESSPKPRLDGVFDGLKGIELHLDLEPAHVQPGAGQQLVDHFAGGRLGI